MIRNDTEHAEKLASVSALMDLEPLPESDDGKVLEALSIEVEEYEKHRWPMRTEIQKGTLENPGEWQRQPGFRIPLITCPQCSGLNLGNSTHRVEENGDVNASMICGHGCGFHEYVMLKDYNAKTEESNHGH
ncbi:hypothetical protein N8Z76_00475 [Gammaproteobacteria bacterium]|nr:hypothetical protein [Gammaproteobacteria bacterium]